jgi:hypothetical protein
VVSERDGSVGLHGFAGTPRRKDNHSEDRGIDGRIRSELILGRSAGRCGVGSGGSG